MKKNSLSRVITTSLLFVLLSSCGSQKEVSEIAEGGNQDLEISNKEQEVFESGGNEPVEISDEKTEYEIIIIEPGFYVWLQSIARPVGYYSQSFLETRNQFLVTSYNIRVNQPQRFNPNLYEQRINYDPNIDYGYDVNYKLYNYFIFFQRRFNQRLSGFFPRI